MSTHEIVIVGANQAGVPMAHYLLKHTIPQLEALKPSSKYHVTMISPNTSYYFKIAAPKAVVTHDNFPVDGFMKPIAPAFAQYPAGSWQHVIGKAASVDKAAKTVSVKLSDGGDKTVSYDSLVLATGVHYESAIWTAEYGDEAIVSAQQKMQKSIAGGEHVMVVGGGPVGVETAGQIAVIHPGKKITLVTGGPTVLQTLGIDKVSKAAEQQLEALKVTLVKDLRVKATREDGAGKTVVTYADGSEVTVDAYINAFAGKPIVDYVPAEWLDNGHVRTDKETLRVQGDAAAHVYAIGDVHNNSDKQSMSVGNSVGPIGTALALDVIASWTEEEKATSLAAAGENRGLLAWLLGLFGIGGGKKALPVQKKFKTLAHTQIVPIGNSGTGAFMGYKLPGFFVYQGKGKSFLTNIVQPQVDGSAFAKP